MGPCSLVRGAAVTAIVVLGAACAHSGGVREEPAAAGGMLVVLNKGAASASLIDPRSGETVATIPTGAGPHEVAVAPGGKLAVVTDYGADTPGSTLTVIDLDARTVARTIDLSPLRRPHGVAWLPDTQRVVVTAEADSALAVVNVRTGRVEGTVATGQGVSHMVALSPDGSRAYVANIGSGSVSMIDVAGRFLVRTTPTGAGAEGIAVTPDGAELWVTNRAANTVTVLDAETLAPRDTLASANFPIRVTFTPDGELALVTNARSGELRIFDRWTRDTVATIPMRSDTTAARGTILGASLGETPGTGVPIGVLVSPDSRTAYVANANVDAVTVVDLVELRVTGYLKTGREPDGLGWIERE
ncbi:MAG TPA: YncE family protein [Gemmatimonadales bacterium]